VEETYRATPEVTDGKGAGIVKVGASGSSDSASSTEKVSSRRDTAAESATPGVTMGESQKRQREENLFSSRFEVTPSLLKN